MKTPYAVFLIIFCILAAFGNILHLFLMEDFGPGFIQYYNSYPGIALMQWVSLIFDILLLFCVLISLFIGNKHPDKSRRILIVPLVISFVIIWVELLYSSFEIYGFGKHQDTFGGINNLGLIGSFVLSSYIIHILFTKSSNSEFIVFIIVSNFFLHILMDYIL